MIHEVLLFALEFLQVLVVFGIAVNWEAISASSYGNAQDIRKSWIVFSLSIQLSGFLIVFTEVGDWLEHF